MKPALVARLKRLESRKQENAQLAYRIGVLRPLPADHTGERHVVIVKRYPSAGNVESCKFEECPGPAPLGSDDGVPTVYMSEDEWNL